MRISKNKGKLPYAYSLSESLKYKEPKNSTKQMVIFYVHTAAGKKKISFRDERETSMPNGNCISFCLQKR